MDLNNLHATFEMNEAPLRRDSLQQQIYDKLRHRLIVGAYRPGETISSRGLAEKLGVSAMPVREALTRLTAEGALELTRSRTLRLRLLRPDDFDEITAIRLDLEGRAAARAATTITPAGIDTVRQAHVWLCDAAAAGDLDAYLAANAAFHRHIYAAADWPLLLGMIERLWMIVGPSIRACLPDAGQFTTSMAFHDDALDALVAQDKAAIQAAITGDIRSAAADIRSFLAIGFGKESK